VGGGDQQGDDKGGFLWLLLLKDGWQTLPPDSISYAFLPGRDLIYNYNKVFEFLLHYSCVEFFLQWFSCLFSQRRKKMQTARIV